MKKKKKTISAAIPEEMDRTIREICQTTRQTMSNYYRSALSLKNTLDANTPELLLLSARGAEVREKNRKDLDPELYETLYDLMTSMIRLTIEEANLP